LDGSGFWSEWRYALGNQVGVDEIRAIRFAEQKFSRKSCFAGTIGADDDDSFGLRVHLLRKSNALWMRIEMGNFPSSKDA
jgi:hypothetical protein